MSRFSLKELLTDGIPYPARLTRLATHDPEAIAALLGSLLVPIGWLTLPLCRLITQAPLS